MTMTWEQGTQSYKELAAWVLARAKAAGAGDCRVRVSKQRFVAVRYREKKAELVSEAVTRSLVLEVFTDRRYGVQQTPDFRKGSLEDFVSETVARAKITEEDPYRCLPDAGRYAGRPNLDLGLVDTGHADLTLQDRHRLAKDVEQSCMDRGGDLVISVEATAYDQDDEQWVLSSNGFEGSVRGTEFWAGAQMSVRDQGDRKPQVHHFVGSRLRRDLSHADEIGIALANRSKQALGAVKIKTETLPLIIENRCAGGLVGQFLNAMSGRSLQQQQSFLMGKKGKKVGSPVFTLTDDPLIRGAFGSRHFDGDGFPAQRRDMVVQGILGDYFVDWYYSRKLKSEPTTGGASNLVLTAGPRSMDSMIKDFRRCVVVSDFIGGNSNPTTGDFSMGITGTLYEKGRSVQAVAEMNIAGNHLDFWDRLFEVGNDPWIYGRLRMPSLAFDAVVLSGK